MILRITSAPKEAWELYFAATPRVCMLRRSTRCVTSVVVPISAATHMFSGVVSPASTSTISVSRPRRPVIAVTSQLLFRSKVGSRRVTFRPIWKSSNPAARLRACSSR